MTDITEALLTPERTIQRDVLTILHVEDDDITREICTAFLRDAFPEARMYEASNGYEALNRILEHPPTLLITNVMMPGMTGIELIRELGKRGLEIPTLATSGYYSEERFRRDGVLLCGKLRFIKKPFTAEHYIAEIQLLMAATGDVL